MAKGPSPTGSAIFSRVIVPSAAAPSGSLTNVHDVSVPLSGKNSTVGGSARKMSDRSPPVAVSTQEIEVFTKPGNATSERNATAVSVVTGMVTTPGAPKVVTGNVSVYSREPSNANTSRVKLNGAAGGSKGESSCLNTRKVMGSSAVAAATTGKVMVPVAPTPVLCPRNGEPPSTDKSMNSRSPSVTV